MSYDRETVRAYVDGELDEIAAERMMQAAVADPKLAELIASDTRLRAALAAEFGPILDEPIPRHFVVPIDAARKVVSLEEVRKRKFGINSRTMRWAVPAMAAALVVAVLLPLGRGPVETRQGLTFAANDLARALDDQLVSDQPDGGDTRILLSFADHGGTLCRGFIRADLSGIACKDTEGWRLRLQRDGINVAAGDYRQASSIDSAIMTAAQEMANGPALDADEERAAKGRRWRSR